MHVAGRQAGPRSDVAQRHWSAGLDDKVEDAETDLDRLDALAAGRRFPGGGQRHDIGRRRAVTLVPARRAVASRHSLSLVSLRCVGSGETASRQGSRLRHSRLEAELLHQLPGRARCRRHDRHPGHCLHGRDGGRGGHPHAGRQDDGIDAPYVSGRAVPTGHFPRWAASISAVAATARRPRSMKESMLSGRSMPGLLAQSLQRPRGRRKARRDGLRRRGRGDR